MSQAISNKSCAYSLLVAVACSLFLSGLSAAKGETTKKKILGLDKVIAFYGAPTELKSPTFALTDAKNWKMWVDRGAVAARGKVWFDLLKNPIETGAEIMANVDFGGNPNPVLCIDEFGFDYDGQIDLKTAKLLRLAKKKSPNTRLAVWTIWTRGAVPPKLAAAYRDVVDLVLMEIYLDQGESWCIAFQLQAARLNGILDKSIAALGLGEEAPHGGSMPWIRTKEELEQEVNIIRMVAPESSGLGFFGRWKLKQEGFPLTLQEIDELCLQFENIPTDGSGLRPALLDVAKTFTKRYKKPAIFASPGFVYYNRSTGYRGADGKWTGFGDRVEPHEWRAFVMNLGEQDANDVVVELRHYGADKPFAKGTVDIPARSTAVAELHDIPGRELEAEKARKEKHYHVGRWNMDVRVPGRNFVTSTRIADGPAQLDGAKRAKKVHRGIGKASQHPSAKVVDMANPQEVDGFTFLFNFARNNPLPNNCPCEPCKSNS